MEIGQSCPTGLVCCGSPDWSKIKGSVYSLEQMSRGIRTLPIFRWIHRSFSKSRQTLRRTRVLRTSRSLSRDRGLGPRSARGFGRGRSHLRTLRRRTLKVVSAMVSHDCCNARLLQVDQGFDVDVHPKTSETRADDQTNCDRHRGACQ